MTFKLILFFSILLFSGGIKSILDNGMSVHLTNEDDSTSLHVSAPYGNLEATKTFVLRSAHLDKTNKDVFTPKLLDEFTGKIEFFRYSLRHKNRY